MKDATPRIRRQPIPADAVLVVRGDDDADRLSEAAHFFLRRYPAWGRYGLSAYHADGDAEIDLLCRVELVRFPQIVVLTRHDLDLAGVEVVPTFHRPHVTLAAADLGLLLEAIGPATDRRVNTYHVEERN